MITKTFKLTPKSQVTLPEQVKEALKVKSGDSVYFSIKKGHVEILPSKEEPITIFELGAKYRKKAKRKVSIEEMNQAIRSKQQEQARKNK